MLKVYTSYNCSSCKKLINMLEKNFIEFEEINFFSKDLSYDNINEILECTNNGFEDILSTRSKVYINNTSKIEKMTVLEIIDFITNNPSVLKRPILIDTQFKSFLTGYNKEEVLEFIEEYYD